MGVDIKPPNTALIPAKVATRVSSSSPPVLRESHVPAPPAAVPRGASGLSEAPPISETIAISCAAGTVLVSTSPSSSSAMKPLSLAGDLQDLVEETDDQTGSDWDDHCLRATREPLEAVLIGPDGMDAGFDDKEVGNTDDPTHDSRRTACQITRP